MNSHCGPSQKGMDTYVATATSGSTITPDITNPPVAEKAR